MRRSACVVAVLALLVGGVAGADDAPPVRPPVVATGPLAVSADGAVACGAILVLTAIHEGDGGQASASVNAPCALEGTADLSITIYQDLVQIAADDCPLGQDQCDADGTFTHSLAADGITTLRAVAEITWIAPGVAPEERHFVFATPLYCDGLGVINQQTVNCSLAADLTFSGLDP